MSSESKLSLRTERAARRTLINGQLVATDIPAEQHGSHSVYANWCCRCTPCTESNSSWSLKMRRNREARRTIVDGRWFAPDAKEHGVYSTYVNWGCRCDPCTDANMDRGQRMADAKR